MELILSYNFNLEDIGNFDFRELYGVKRRDSAFAAVIRKDGNYYALRDHLGITPLFYRKANGKYFFATNLDDLIKTIGTNKLSIDPKGLSLYLGTGTTKIYSLFREVGVVPAGAVLKFSPDQDKPILLYQYTVKPAKISLWASKKSLIEQFSKLFSQALRRQTKLDCVGVYLSGGIDSGLIISNLKKLGIMVQTFSSATGGQNSTEIPFIKDNLKRANVHQAHIDYLRDDYEALSSQLINLYSLPHGNPTGLAVSSLWLNTPISEQKQIFLGQNCDVILNAMDNDHLLTFSYALPKIFRKILGLNLNKMLARYTKKQTAGLVDFCPVDIEKDYRKSNFNNFQLVSLAGILVGRTPSDGESLVQPAINKNIVVANPYYDLDLVEFCLGLRLTHKYRFLKNKKIVSFDKKLIREFALAEGYPKNLVYRKKGFTVPQGRSSSEPPGRAKYFRNLKKKICGIECRTINQRFAADILAKYLESRGLSHLLKESVTQTNQRMLL